MKDKSTAGVLALLLGGLGVHKFYLNRPVQGLFYLVTCFTFIPAFIGFLEGLTYLFNTQEWFDNKYNPITKAQMTTVIHSENISAVEELEKLGSLLEKGILTQNEFDQKKEIILKKIA